MFLHVQNHAAPWTLSGGVKPNEGATLRRIARYLAACRWAAPRL